MNPREYLDPDGSPDELYFWRQIQEGNKDGLEGLYVRYSQELFRLGMSIKPDRSLIKDCIHDVFLALWQYRGKLKNTDNVKLYLFKCLSHKIYKEVGKDKKRYGSIHGEDYETLLYVDTAESNIAYEQIDEKKKANLLAALGKLPVRQREIVQYLFFESHSYEDIANIMGINVQSAYTLAWKAISNLKKSLISLWTCVLALFF